MLKETMWQAIGSGFLMQMGIIMSLGMQNLYVIKKGIRKEYPFWVALTCVACEVILVVLGVVGAGALLKLAPGMEGYLMVAAAGFLLVYGGRSLYQAIWGEKVALENPVNDRPATLVGSILAAIGFSLLNPQAIFESIIFFGGMAPKFGESAPYFLVGAVMASFVWLFSLASVTTFAIPQQPSRKTMRILEATSGGILMTIGVGLIV
ncbi:LysE/ArgO family amino acid transporter [Pseudobacteriovorax antillogorgiicola]|uniref:L-lysine exporter family protein LysE/ArgO n=1 Tax=Pseudobacteriovorax antillogorgiicola TaxID=1513793 RepID=A0A1Y6BID0_9BACT|nr:LysE family transporter [Pseudobacteriovorax antillogorgiicola]TCS57310.1 L-lysine exporter family protein LysE/ArgO [Pseudobacteriovorax antillogorgiicola]SMF02653.1 L-lysine exporter family protein LysE/ArgO [Pseudobacteriovorax antillogorgiicola]